jgi:hypothetical protein
VRPWNWTTKREEAARKIAERRSDQPAALIAQELKVDPKTLRNWLRYQEFKDRIEEHRREMAESLKRAGLRIKENRLDTLNDICQRIYKVIDARATAYYSEAEGGDSGLLARRYTQKLNELIPEYRFDAPLVKELREVMKHAAIELGEWVEKQQVDNGASAPLPVDIRLTIDKVYGEDEPEKQEDGNSEETNSN